MAGAAEFAAANAHRLAGIAHDQVQKIDDAMPEKSLLAIQRFGAVAKLANVDNFNPLSLLSVRPASIFIDYANWGKLLATW
ncbi:MAG: hypothetical protein EOP81_00120 [Variovorax sp.]|nr:MAG: hypothetical protein EOP81_00120 [Variovorax sp.]